jgi:hypothetical protein
LPLLSLEPPDRDPYHDGYGDDQEVESIKRSEQGLTAGAQGDHMLHAYSDQMQHGTAQVSQSSPLRDPGCIFGTQRNLPFARQPQDEYAASAYAPLLPRTTLSSRVPSRCPVNL